MYVNIINLKFSFKINGRYHYCVTSVCLTFIFEKVNANCSAKCYTFVKVPLLFSADNVLFSHDRTSDDKPRVTYGALGLTKNRYL